MLIIFLKFRRQVVEIPEICQECLLCKHGRPYLPFVDQPNDEPSGFNLWPIFETKKELKHPQAFPLMEKEWTQLVEAYRRHVDQQHEPPPIYLQENGP